MINKYCLIIFLLFASCQERIIHNLTELDANRIITKLHQAKIKSNKEKQADGFWSIAVAESKVIEAIQLIEDYRFFKKPEPAEQKSKLLSSEQEQKLIYERALSQQLETTLQSLSGVLEVHVLFNINKDQDLWKKVNLSKKNSTAGVLLIVNQQFVLTSDELKQLVSGASGINQEQINIVISYPQITEMPSEVPEVNSTPTPVQNLTLINNFLAHSKALFKQVFSEDYFFISFIVISLLSCVYTTYALIQNKKIQKFKRSLRT